MKLIEVENEVHSFIGEDTVVHTKKHNHLE